MIIRKIMKLQTSVGYLRHQSFVIEFNCTQGNEVWERTKLKVFVQINSYGLAKTKSRSGMHEHTRALLDLISEGPSAEIPSCYSPVNCLDRNNIFSTSVLIKIEL